MLKYQAWDILILDASAQGSVQRVFAAADLEIQ